MSSLSGPLETVRTYIRPFDVMLTYVCGEARRHTHIFAVIATLCKTNNKENILVKSCMRGRAALGHVVLYLEDKWHSGPLILREKPLSEGKPKL